VWRGFQRSLAMSGGEGRHSHVIPVRNISASLRGKWTMPARRNASIPCRMTPYMLCVPVPYEALHRAAGSPTPSGAARTTHDPCRRDKTRSGWGGVVPKVGGTRRNALASNSNGVIRGARVAGTHFVDREAICQFVEGGEHVREHEKDLGGGELGGEAGEADNVAEQDHHCGRRGMEREGYRYAEKEGRIRRRTSAGNEWPFSVNVIAVRRDQQTMR
jgi:hypothetical protein